MAHAMRNARGRPVVLVGSSYSASWALVLAAAPTRLTAVAAFSPGEWLKGLSVADAAAALAVPAFVTAARAEMAGVRELLGGAPSGRLDLHEPREAGAHGARCLWERTPGSEGYRQAFLAFLERIAGDGG